MALFAGGCACGKVRYQAASDPIATRICLCRDCQRMTGGAGTVLAFFATDTVKIEGETGDFVSTADSGNIMHRRFCPECGTPLFSGAEVRPHLTGIRVGSLDDPSSVTPQAIIWTQSAPAWAHLDPNLDHYPGQMPAAPPK
jgi:hypothetical protein